jgi:hypothetical protein
MNSAHTPSPFTSLEQFRQAFTVGLAGMLDQHADLGVFILVLANAAYDPQLWAQLRIPLFERFQRQSGEITAALRTGRRIDAPDDDLLVFLKLMAMGFEHIEPVEQRRLGEPELAQFELTYNPVRTLRPPRVSGGRIDTLRREFDAAGFHFNKPFLARERLWQGELAGKPAQLLYNKFPFADLHGLLVPEPRRELPQFLTPELFGWAWQVTMESAASLPGFTLAYNSYGAHASVNHLHFQTCLRATPLPLQTGAFQHNGGERAYPLAVDVFTDREEAWLRLDELHTAGQPYNLVMDADRLWLVPRTPQGSVVPAAWHAGLAWSELAGAFTVFSGDDFRRLTAADLSSELARHIP